MHMPLSVADKLGPYAILAPIGAGGMGAQSAQRLLRFLAPKARDILNTG
jgi:hypothetical protein